jgi:hypothetical protein
MIACKKSVEMSGSVSWIVDELVRIRLLEQCLCKTIHSSGADDLPDLFNRIQHLNRRVDDLDRALNDYASPAQRS